MFMCIYVYVRTYVHACKTLYLRTYVYTLCVVTIHICAYVCTTYVYNVFIICTCIISYVGALSVTDSDDDYCISCTVTIVDVRSCTRPPRLLDQQHISENPLMSIPPRLLDHTIISKSTDDSRPQLSNVIGTYVCTYVW